MAIAYPGFPESFFYQQLSELPGIGLTLAKRLYETGFTTATDLRSASDQQLRAVKGVGPKVIAKLRASSRLDG